MTYKEILLNFSDYFTQYNIVNDVLRSIGWMLVKILQTLCDAIEFVFDTSFDLISFTSYVGVENMIRSYAPIFVPLVTIAFIILGFYLMSTAKKPPIIKNIIICMATIMVLPTLIISANQILTIQKDISFKDMSMAENTIKANIVDLLYMDSLGWVETGETNNLEASQLNYINTNTVIDNGSDLFSHYLEINESGEISYKKIKDGWFDIFEPPYYYRFYIDFLSIYLGLIINAFVLLFASYKVVRLTWEIIVSRIIATITSPVFTNGQKATKALMGILECYAALLAILVMFQLYNIFQAFLNTLGINSIASTILMGFAGFTVVDGPNIVEKIFGVDAGLSSGAEKLQSFIQTALLLRSHSSSKTDSSTDNNPMKD